MEYATDNGKVLFESLWRTRHENDVPINEMEDEHLINTIGYLQSRVDIQEYDDTRSYTLAITNLPQTEHNIEVLKRELIRRAEEAEG